MRDPVLDRMAAAVALGSRRRVSGRGLSGREPDQAGHVGDQVGEAQLGYACRSLGNAMLGLLKTLLPAALYHGLRRRRTQLRAVRTLLRVFVHDFRQYYRASALGFRYDDRERMRSMLIIDCHKLEKGMSLPQPRLGFGVDTIKRLLDNMSRYVANFGPDYVTDWSVSALHAYRGLHAVTDRDVSWFAADLKRIEARTQRPVLPEAGGMIDFVPDRSARWGSETFAAFAAARRSARIFTSKPVDPECLHRAARTAQHTPSVCNRQSGRIHVYRDPVVMAALLAAQGGSRGFGDTADVIVAVTSDRRCFQTPQERNQCWVDGGLFAMTFIYALHAEGLGSCCLNWSRDVADDRTAHAVGDIPKHEAIIMLLAIGHMPDTLRVARSTRRPLEAVFCEHG